MVTLSTTPAVDDAVQVLGAVSAEQRPVLDTATRHLLAVLHRELEPARQGLLARRAVRQAAVDAGAPLDFPARSARRRAALWTVPPPPADLLDRRVEITGPTDPKTVINALNCGASVFMADFEDATTPRWDILLDGQVTLAAAVRGTLEHAEPGGKRYVLGPNPAVLMVRPRGWHLDERHLRVDGQTVSGALFDTAAYLAGNATALLERGSGPYLYLPKLQGAEEAALWRQALDLCEDVLGLPEGSIRTTVLVETLPAAFEMEEILDALGPHALGLNAGRWDYIFSAIKTRRFDPAAVLPDRAQVTMTVPFMAAYSDLLVATCRRRGAQPIGGMAAFIPSRRDPEANERALAQVRADKIREATAGFVGTWVAHPDLVPVARAAFDEVVGAPKAADDLAGAGRDAPVVGVPGPDDAAPWPPVSAATLLDTTVPDGTVTMAGVRNDVAVCLRYLESWLRGRGAVAIFGLMEDAATAEIARAQLWQWRVHGVPVDGGPPLDAERIAAIADAEQATIEAELAEAGLSTGSVHLARQILDRLVLAADLPEFLTVIAQEHLA
jgi:malate synthase